MKKACVAAWLLQEAANTWNFSTETSKGEEENTRRSKKQAQFASPRPQSQDRMYEGISEPRFQQS